MGVWYVHICVCVCLPSSLHGCLAGRTAQCRAFGRDRQSISHLLPTLPYPTLPTLYTPGLCPLRHTNGGRATSPQGGYEPLGSCQRVAIHLDDGIDQCLDPAVLERCPFRILGCPGLEGNVAHTHTRIHIHDNPSSWSYVALIAATGGLVIGHPCNTGCVALPVPKVSVLVFLLISVLCVCVYA